MIGVLPKIPLFMLGRRLGWPRPLPVSLTVTPSARCNSRCLTCNIWQKRDGELSLAEWDRTFRSLGRAPFWFTISGGEPFLFKDLLALCRSLYEHCRPGIINIPTNSLLCEQIPAKVDQICGACLDSQVIINLSLDGVGEKHDRIRGVPGNFARFERNYRALRDLRRPNLTIGIHSVISRYSVADAPELFDYAFGLQPDSYITEIAEERVELATVGAGVTPSPAEYSVAIDNLIDLVAARQFRGIAKVTEAFRLEYYRLVKRILAEQTQVIPCYAGWASAQIYSDGTVWPCCVRADAIGNLKEADYDFAAVWFSPEAEKVRASIRRKECYCPLANASYTNMLMHFPTLVRVGAKVALSSLPAAGTPTGPGGLSYPSRSQP